jgi:hypothetical protein
MRFPSQHSGFGAATDRHQPFLVALAQHHHVPAPGLAGMAGQRHQLAGTQAGAIEEFHQRGGAQRDCVVRPGGEFLRQRREQSLHIARRQRFRQRPRCLRQRQITTRIISAEMLRPSGN